MEWRPRWMLATTQSRLSVEPVQRIEVPRAMEESCMD